jgi:hypothetical protein
MPSTLTWLDHDAIERDRMNRVLALFQERSTVDELGLGGIRDSLADLLFPGTSTIQTRLRYLLFVPWIYRRLEASWTSSAEIARKARQLELRLVDPLLSTEEEGIFGRVARGNLKRLPSAVYWGGLGLWGIRRFPGSQDRYHRALDGIYLRRRFLARREDGDRAMEAAAQTWHPALPPEPAGFPDDVGIAMGAAEAGFVLDRIMTSQPGSFLGAVARLHRTPSVALPWQAAHVPGATAEHRSVLEHARRFSELRHGAAILYNLMLSELGSRTALIDEHQDSLARWHAALDVDDLHLWDLDDLWRITAGQTHTITPNARDFVGRWRDEVCTSLVDLAGSEVARQLVLRREMLLKGPRSRFTNQRVREEHWKGRAGLRRVDYRWANVRALMDDLHAGLAS